MRRWPASDMAHDLTQVQCCPLLSCVRLFQHSTSFPLLTPSPIRIDEPDCVGRLQTQAGTSDIPGQQHRHAGRRPNNKRGVGKNHLRWLSVPSLGSRNKPQGLPHGCRDYYAVVLDLLVGLSSAIHPMPRAIHYTQLIVSSLRSIKTPKSE